MKTLTTELKAQFEESCKLEEEIKKTDVGDEDGE